jgi:GDP-L-fucose synthase
MEFKGRVHFDLSKPDGQYRKPSDVTKLHEYRPDFVFTPVEQGIRATVDWLVSHYPEARR